LDINDRHLPDYKEEKEPLKKSSGSWLLGKLEYSQCSHPHVLRGPNLIYEAKARNAASATLITHFPGDVGQGSTIVCFAGLLARGSDIDSTIRTAALRVCDREKSPVVAVFGRGGFIQRFLNTSFSVTLVLQKHSPYGYL
jgi:hypothetical protein